jgi:hypothetical protein
MYTPDRWAIVQITDKKANTITNRIFSSWTGNFFTGNSSRVSSEIVDKDDMGLFYEITTKTGSKYHCYKASYFPGNQPPVENDEELIQILQTHNM